MIWLNDQGLRLLFMVNVQWWSWRVGYKDQVNV